MGSQVATEVSMMMTDNAVLKSENEALRTKLASLQNEADNLRSELLDTRRDRDEWMMKATEVQTLIEQTSNSLIDGINRLRASRRHRQERTLGVGDKASMPEMFRKAIEEATPNPVPISEEDAGKARDYVDGRFYAHADPSPAIRNRAPRDKTEEWDMRPREKAARVENQSTTVFPKIGANVRTDIVDTRLPPLDDARLPKPRLIEEAKSSTERKMDGLAELIQMAESMPPATNR